VTAIPQTNTELAAGPAGGIAFRAVTTRNDWKKFQLEAYRQSFRAFPVLRAASGAFCCGFALLVVLAVLVGGIGLAFAAFAVAMWGAVLVADDCMYRSVHARRAGELQMTFGPGGVTIFASGRTTTFEWSAIRGWAEDRGRFHVVIAPLIGWPLPKAGFVSEQALTEFRIQLARHCAPRRVSGPQPGR
jgi:hypothetical protein